MRDGADWTPDDLVALVQSLETLQMDEPHAVLQQALERGLDSVLVEVQIWNADATILTRRLGTLHVAARIITFDADEEMKDDG